MTALKRPLLVTILLAVVVALVTSAAVAVSADSGSLFGPARVRTGERPIGRGSLSVLPKATPSLPGAVVNVALWDMGGPMLGPRDGMMDGRYMTLRTDKATVIHGTVSFLVTNGGSINHEMVILPDDHIVGSGPIGGDARIDEAGSIGEASRSGGGGVGKGIAPSTAGWVTVTLAAGEYELVCNFPRHYTAGMHTQLTVT